MRRRLLAVLMMLLLPLSACGGETDDLRVPMGFRAALLAAGTCRFTAQMRVDVQGSLYDLTLDCACDPDGTCAVNVLAPASLEGVRATFDGSGGLLSFDGMAVDFGLLAEQELAPILLPLRMVEYWRGAYILAAGQEEGLLRVSYQDDTSDLDLFVDTWFDGDTPTYTEISLNGTVAAELRLTEFRLDGG